MRATFQRRRALGAVIEIEIRETVMDAPSNNLIIVWAFVWRTSNINGLACTQASSRDTGDGDVESVVPGSTIPKFRIDRNVRPLLLQSQSTISTLSL